MTDNPRKTTTRGRLNRRVFLASTAAAGAALAAPWVTTKARAAGSINVILNQGLLAKLWVDELHPAFEKETGASVNVQQSVTSNMLAMLKTQKDNPPDLMQFSEAGVFVAADEGLLRQYKTANIPNFAKLRPAFNMADDYSAGCVDAMHTIFYNTNRVSEGPDAWADLWQSENNGRIAIPPVTWNSGVRMVTTAAQIATGKPLQEAQYDIDAGIAKLAELKDNGVEVYTGAPQAIQMVQSGQVPLVPFYGVFINPLIAKGAPLAPATELAEGKHGEIVGLNMPTNAPNAELAEVYVNMSLSTEFQKKIDSTLHALAGNSEVDPSARTLELVGPPGNTTYADWRFLSENRPMITEKWNEVFG